MLRILTFHRVLPLDAEPRPNPSLVSAEPEAFTAQVRHLAARYRVVSLEQVWDAFRKGLRLPNRAVLVTFDDAYRDIQDVAWPILRRHRLPATVFVPTAYPDRPQHSFWWDRVHAALEGAAEAVVDCSADPDPDVRADLRRPLPLASAGQRRDARRSIQTLVKRLPHDAAMSFVDRLCERLGLELPLGLSPVLTWDELRALRDDGMSLAPHTRTHPALTRMSLTEARAEIRGSRDDLERETGPTFPVFSYPFGAHDDGVVGVTRDVGFRLAVTCIDGQNDLRRDDPLRLRRTNVTRRTSPFIFRLRLLRAVSHLDRWRHGAAVL